MKTMFDSADLGRLKVKNLVFRSATFEGGSGQDGVLTPMLKETYDELAKGGVDVIITGMLGVGPKSCLMPDQPQILREEFIPKFKEVTDVVHGYGSKVIVQLGHCGVKSLAIDEGDSPVGPSDYTPKRGLPARAMTKEEIKTLIGDYGKAALACKAAGADGVQLHSAHGYLLSQFLSPYFNKREDEYGGSVENRARIIFEAYDEIRRVAPDYPIWIKINHTDLVEGALGEEDSLWVCKALAERGIDAIELSAGIAVDRNSGPSQVLKSDDDEGSYVKGALKYSKEVKAPIISVGGFRTPAVIEHWLNEGNIAAVSLCRPLISEPDILNRWKAGDKTKAKCISCNRCYTFPVLGCALNQPSE